MKMRHEISGKVRTQVFLLLLSAAVPLLFAGCSDDWNDHYDASTADNGTLWQALKNDKSLANFVSVAEACGYDVVLGGSQNYTVFVPTDNYFTTAEADSLIAEFRKQQAANVHSDDNTVVRQFLQNHIALYKQPISSLTNDTITLLNDKYAVLTATHLGNRELIGKNDLYNNGLLFTIDGKLDYMPNVFEYLGHDRDLDSVYQFLKRYNVYEFNDAKSVPGEIIDGMTHYLDSVSDLHNALLEQLGLINSEDSTYWLVCPTNEQWDSLLTVYTPYFNYPRDVAKRDSLIYVQSRLAIIGGAFFSRTLNPDVAFSDSAVSTLAPSAQARQLLDADYPYYTYYKPFEPGGVFYGTDDIACSNGHVLKAAKYNISKFDTFLQTTRVEAEDIQSQDSIIDAVSPLLVREVLSNNAFYGQVSKNSFAEVVPSTATAQVQVSFKLPNLLSNVKYDIYGVFAPATAYDTLATEESLRPNIVNTTLYWRDQNGKETKRPFGNKTVTTTKVDTLLLVSNFAVPTCSYGTSEAQVKLLVKSNLSDKQLATHSGTLRIDCFIVKPHEQKATRRARRTSTNH